jgi:hypothetical protein
MKEHAELQIVSYRSRHKFVEVMGPVNLSFARLGLSTVTEARLQAFVIFEKTRAMLEFMGRRKCLNTLCIKLLPTLSDHFEVRT